MTKTITQINQLLMKKVAKRIKEVCKLYGPGSEHNNPGYAIEHYQDGLGGYCYDSWKDTIANDYARFYQEIADNIDQAQPLFVNTNHWPLNYQFDNGYENDPDVDSWIKNKKDREFYISQAKVEEAV